MNQYVQSNLQRGKIKYIYALEGISQSLDANK